MLQRNLRTFTAEEADVLETELLRLSSGAPSRLYRTVFLVTLSLFGMGAGLLCGLVLAVMLMCREIPSAPIVLGCIVAGAVCGAWIAKRSLASAEKARDDRIVILACRLLQGEMEIVRVVAYGAVAVVEDEDESPAFFLDIGDEQVLFVRGPYVWELYAEDETDETALHSEFVLLHYKDEPEDIVRVEAWGAVLPPARTIFWRDYAASQRFSDGDVLSGVSLTTLERDLEEFVTAEPLDE